MNLKIFGDTQKIDWDALNVRMPFAPMHELAEKYELEPHVTHPLHTPQNRCTVKDLKRIFEIQKKCTHVSHSNITQRVYYRVRNTIAALDQCTPDTICLNLGGGMHHAGKYPNTGYAYSLINDIIWAVDYQLDQGKTIAIIDLDFHFGGGTWEYYKTSNTTKNVVLEDIHSKHGVLYKHKDLICNLISGSDPFPESQCMQYFSSWEQPDKILLNIGTDWSNTDSLFGKFGMPPEKLLANWQKSIEHMLKITPSLAITMGGGYGSEGLKLYTELITWIQEL